MSALADRFPTLFLHASLVTPSKPTPKLYLHLATLISSTQSPAAFGSISPPPPLSAPPFQATKSNSGGRVIFNPDPSLLRARSPLVHTLCSGCGRPALTSAPERHWYCSSLCALACHLFISDLLALSQRRLFRPHAGPAPLLRYIHPASLPAYDRQLRAQYGQLLNKALVTSPEWALAFASSLYPHPRALRVSLKRHLAMMRKARPGDPAYSLYHKGHFKMPRPAPTPPISEDASRHDASLRDASRSDTSLLAISSLSNPVTRRTAEIVLKHLATADDFLSNTSAAPSPSKLPKKDKAFAEHELPPTPTGVIWNKQQVALFLGLLNRTIPAISASINLSAAGDNKDPSEMSREELEAAARRAKIIDIPKDKANDPQPEQQEPL